MGTRLINTEINRESSFNGGMAYQVNNTYIADTYEDALKLSGNLLSPNGHTPISNPIDQIQYFCNMRRGAGSTRWIISAAILNPKCVIVCKNRATLTYAEEMFNELITDSEVFSEIYRSNNNEKPTFITLDNLSYLTGREQLPIIFDNSCFF